MIRIGEFAGAQVSLDYSDDVRIVLRWRLREGDQLLRYAVRRFVMQHTQRQELALRCEQAARYIAEAI